MITLAFLLDHQVISRSDKNTVVAGSKNYVRARFILRTDDWVRPITAIFGGYTQLLDDNNECTVPWEVLQQPGKVEVSAFCGDLHTANIAVVPVEKTGYKSGETPKDPTPDVYQQFLQAVKDDAATAENAAKTAQAEAEKAATSAGQAASSAAEAAQSATNAAAEVGKVQSAGTSAVQAVQAAQNTATEAVSAAQQTATQTVSKAQATAVSAVQEAGATQVSVVGTAGADAVEDVNNAKTAALEEIDAANAALPVPTVSDAGKVPTVNDAGTGYVLGEAQVDAYTKAESDARYAPIAAAIRPTASGNPVNITDSVEWPLQGLTVYGKSTQDGTPSPENPVPIVSAGDGGSIVLTVSDGADRSQSLTISTPNGLPGIPVDSGGNYTDAEGQQWVCDEIDYVAGKHIHQVGKLVVDGTDIKFIYGQPETFWNIQGGPELRIKTLDNYKIISNYFPNNIFDANVNWDFIFTDSDKMSPYFQSLDELNAFLVGKNSAGNPLIIYYLLNEKHETTISPEELTAYRALHTYDGATVVSTAENVAGLEVRYLADGEKYVERIVSQKAPEAAAAHTMALLADGIREGVNGV